MTQITHLVEMSATGSKIRGRDQYYGTKPNFGLCVARKGFPPPLRRPDIDPGIDAPLSCACQHHGRALGLGLTSFAIFE
jgi:hypothetical protein